MTAPMVAVIGYHLEVGRVTRWRHGGYAAPDAYVDAVRRAGGLPAVIHHDDVDLDRCDAVLLLGGGDIDPARYGHTGDATVYGVDAERDDGEIRILDGALSRGLPVLAICRGIQIVNVAFGGTLVVDLATSSGYGPHGEPGGDATLHELTVAAGSRIASIAGGATTMRVSCHHHQGIDKIGDGLSATAWAGDGLVEALEHAGDPWLVSVQWHPEDTAATDPAQQGLFDALVGQAVHAGVR